MFYVEAFNQKMFLLLNVSESSPDRLILVAKVAAELTIYLIPLLLISLWLWGSTINRRRAVRATLVTLLALGFSQLIGLLWTHPRPFMEGIGRTLLPHAAETSFPSDHVTVFAGIGLTLLFCHAPKVGSATLLIGAITGWARVYLGVHYPLDIIGSVAVVLMTYGVIVPFWRLKEGELVHKAEVLYRELFKRPIESGWLRR